LRQVYFVNVEKGGARKARRCALVHRRARVVRPVHSANKKIAFRAIFC